MGMRLKSPAFGEGERIPTEHSCEGGNSSPKLELEGVPEDTKSLALIMDDPDAPSGTFVHWVAWNIPISEEIPEDAHIGLEGMNSAGRKGYTGPCPPPGHGPHRYYFKVYALDGELDLPEGAGKADLEKAMEGHIIAKAETMGTYERS